MVYQRMYGVVVYQRMYVGSGLLENVRGQWSIRECTWVVVYQRMYVGSGLSENVRGSGLPENVRG